MKKNLVILAAVFLLTSCAPTFKIISISQEETAKITTSAFCPATDSAKNMVSYEVVNFVSDLDSISHYLKLSQDGFCDFEYAPTSFRLAALNGIVQDTSFRSSVPDIMRWEFPKRIVDIQGVGKVGLHRNNRELIVYGTKDNFCSAEEKLDITVTFGDDSDESMVNHPFGFRRSGIAVDVLPGFGLSQVHGDASANMKGSLFINMGFSIILNRTRLISRLAVLNGELSGEIDGAEGSRNFDNASFELGIGQEILNRDFFSFSPVVYFGRNNLELYNRDDVVENTLLHSGYKYALGATIDVKFSQWFRKKDRRQEMRNETLCFKIDGGWYPDYFHKTLSTQGSVTYLTFTISSYLAVDNDFRRVKFRRK